MPPSKTRKVLFEALATATKRFGIQDHILSITTDSASTNDLIARKFEKLAFDTAEHGYSSPSSNPPAIFTAKEGHIRCMVHTVNLSCSSYSQRPQGDCLRADIDVLRRHQLWHCIVPSAISKARRIVARRVYIQLLMFQS